MRIGWTENMIIDNLKCCLYEIVGCGILSLF